MEGDEVEFAKLLYMPQAPSCLTCLTYVVYLRTLWAFFIRLSRLIYAPILFMSIKIFSGWICSPSKSFKFSIKGTTNRAVFYVGHKKTF